MCSRDVTKEGISLEEAAHLLTTHGYQWIARYDHLHGIQYHRSQLFPTLEYEDERHISLLESLPRMTAAEFLALVEKVFQPIPRTALPVAFSPFTSS